MWASSSVALSLLALVALAVEPSLYLPDCSTLLGARQCVTTFTLQRLLTLLTLLLVYLTGLLYCRQVECAGARDAGTLLTFLLAYLTYLLYCRQVKGQGARDFTETLLTLLQAS